MHKEWDDTAWDEYVLWQTQDKKTLIKINKLINDIIRNGEDKGIGHPEPLRDNWSGWWSRHIDEKNRLVYRIIEGRIEIAECGGHYDDK
jgi:toxin YoeB